MSGLHLDFGEGDTIIIGEVSITLGKKTGKRARVTIDAPRESPIELRSATGRNKVFTGDREKSAHECLTQHKPLSEDKSHGPDRNGRQ